MIQFGAAYLCVTDYNLLLRNLILTLIILQEGVIFSINDEISPIRTAD